MARYLVRIEAPATWTIEIHAEDEDEANTKLRELVGDSMGAGEQPVWVVDWDEVDWTLDEVEG